MAVIRSKSCIVTFPCYRYGTDVAAVTDAALATAGNSYLAFYNAGALGMNYTFLSYRDNIGYCRP